MATGGRGEEPDGAAVHVQLRKRAGRPRQSLADALASRGVDLRAIGGGGLGDFGHVIMTTADDDITAGVLDAGGYTYYEGESLITEVPDRPGGMAEISRRLADAGVNIYGHLFIGRGETGRCSPSWWTSRRSPGRSREPGLTAAGSLVRTGCPAGFASPGLRPPHRRDVVGGEVIFLRSISRRARVNWPASRSSSPTMARISMSSPA